MNIGWNLLNPFSSLIGAAILLVAWLLIGPLGFRQLVAGIEKAASEDAKVQAAKTITNTLLVLIAALLLSALVTWAWPVTSPYVTAAFVLLAVFAPTIVKHARGNGGSH